jgi:hypothetical protein
VLAFSAGASATWVRSDAIDPGQRVHGMRVVQGLARDADAELFGVICDPDVLGPGRRTRSCGALPPVRRIFVGHGIWVVSKERLESQWRAYARRTEMWIDGQRVNLARFGHSDRVLPGYPEAGGRDAFLREWSIVLVGAQGRHSIRYRTRSRSGLSDTTWWFTVARQ